MYTSHGMELRLPRRVSEAAPHNDSLKVSWCTSTYTSHDIFVWDAVSGNVVQAKDGLHAYLPWIPASAGMTL